MDRGAWRGTVQGVAESDKTEHVLTQPNFLANLISYYHMNLYTHRAMSHLCFSWVILRSNTHRSCVSHSSACIVQGSGDGQLLVVTSCWALQE